MNASKKRSSPRVGLLGHCAISLGLILGAGFCTLPGVAQERVDLAALDRDLADFRARLGRLRGAIDASPFDPDAQIERLDFEVASILEYVVNEVVFQPYEGTLRGVAGTLRAGAGNSLDQSILLASLLKSAGYDARVARGTLSEGEALRLLGQTVKATPSENLDYLLPGLEQGFTGLAEAGGSIDLRSTNAYADAQSQSQALLDALKSAGINLSPRDVTARWLPVVREYFWVQHREGPSDPWQDAHPGGELCRPGDPLP
jgi:hypothetical protein